MPAAPAAASVAKPAVVLAPPGVGCGKYFHSPEASRPQETLSLYCEGNVMTCRSPPVRLVSVKCVSLLPKRKDACSSPCV